MKSVIFISPHFDDICFSLGGMVPDMRVARKILVNIFTHSGWVSNLEIRAAMEKIEQPLRNATIDHMRDLEDDAFASALQLEKINLRLLDANLLIPPGHPAPAQFYDGMEAEAESVHEKLLPVVRDYIAQEPEAVLISPLAIGEHRNHLVTFDVMTRIAAALTPQVPLMFYEDLPYAASPPKRQARLEKMEAFLKERSYQRYRKDMNDALYLRKAKEVVKYKSQMNRSLEEYAIRTRECPERHEALWANTGAETVSALF